MGSTPGCLRYLLLVMCTHPFAKKALTLHLARSEGHERYFSCNLMHRKVLASSHQHLIAEAPGGTCQQLWDTRELHLVSLDYGGETREVGAIDINIDQDLVA